jgi:pyruvate formate lyase activating enzyme
MPLQDLNESQSPEARGLIHKIERFSLHDGPGIRTLVVMKGCPLRCLWCSSPYTQNTRPEILYIKSRCLGCGRCISVCPKLAITKAGTGTHVQTDRSRCRGCGRCADVCPARARELTGSYITPEELLKEVDKDAAFYRRSGGGITVGGGEPTAQTRFVGQFLKLCSRRFFHTAMETSAFTSWENLSSLLPHLDLVFIDLKHMDEAKHIEWTGVSNRIILENIKKTAVRNKLILRIPIIPGYNDSEQNIARSAEFAGELGDNFLHLELLPYHQLGIHKYEELGRNYTIASIELPSDEHILALRNIAASFGIKTETGS